MIISDDASVYEAGNHWNPVSEPTLEIQHLPEQNLWNMDAVDVLVPGNPAAALNHCF